MRIPAGVRPPGTSALHHWSCNGSREPPAPTDEADRPIRAAGIVPLAAFSFRRLGGLSSGTPSMPGSAATVKI